MENNEWSKFKTAVEAAGLTPVFCNSFHFRITGGAHGVNYYAYSKRKTAHVDGFSTGFMSVSYAQCIEAARVGPSAFKRQRTSKKGMRGHRNSFTRGEE